MTALAEYMGAVLDFEIACINTWLHRRIAATAAAAASGGGSSSGRAAEDPKAVPCLRIMLDPRTSTKLAALFQKAVELVGGDCKHAAGSVRGELVLPQALWSWP